MNERGETGSSCPHVFFYLAGKEFAKIRAQTPELNESPGEGKRYRDI